MTEKDKDHRAAPQGQQSWPEQDCAKPIGWMVEWGAISLPLGHPSRVTYATFYTDEDRAEASLRDADENWNAHMWPVFPPGSAPPANEVAVTVDKLREYQDALRSMCREYERAWREGGNAWAPDWMAHKRGMELLRADLGDETAEAALADTTPTPGGNHA